jgi:hypothetical protein
MTIPESVQLMGVTVPIIWWKDEERSEEELKYHGEAHFSSKRIYLANTCRGVDMTQELKEHTFFHELLHQILDSAGYKKQNDNEQFVDLIAGLLHQALGPHMK